MDPVEERERRERAFSVALNALAQRSDEVQRFRAACLPGGLLTREAAVQFCRSPALAYFSRSELAGAGVSLAEHQAEVIADVRRREGDAGRQEVTVEITPPGVQLTAVREVTRLYDSGPQRRFDVSSGFFDPHQETTVQFWSVNDGQISPEYRDCWDGSVLAELAEVSRLLGITFPIAELDAVHLILSGERIIIPSCTATVQENGLTDPGYFRVHLNVAPWVPPEEVVRVFREEVARTLASPRQRDRELTERTLAVFEFVSDRAPHHLARDSAARRISDDPATWKELLAEWNRTCPAEWAFSPNAAGQSGFQKAFYRWRDLLFPQFKSALDRYGSSSAREDGQ